MKKSFENVFLVVCVVAGIIIMVLAWQFSPDRSRPNVGTTAPARAAPSTLPAAAHPTSTPVTVR